jgi:hypothetical protein
MEHPFYFVFIITTLITVLNLYYIKEILQIERKLN